jgi:hypothetical protein
LKEKVNNPSLVENVNEDLIINLELGLFISNIKNEVCSCYTPIQMKGNVCEHPRDSLPKFLTSNPNLGIGIFK